MIYYTYWAFVSNISIPATANIITKYRAIPDCRCCNSVEQNSQKEPDIIHTGYVRSVSAWIASPRIGCKKSLPLRDSTATDEII